MIELNLVILCIVVFLLSGCDKYQRYEVLSFFFTGVPHPDEKVETSEADVAKPGGAREARQKQQKISSYVHGPFAANECYLCHETSTSITRRSTSKDANKIEQKTPRRFDAALPGRLITPVRELCIECHPSKSAKSAFESNLWLHGPVSNGLCIVCHSPHSSQYMYMLLQGSANQVCTACHKEGFITQIEEHVKGEECTNCHNAHLGKNRFLLKKDFNEIY